MQNIVINSCYGGFGLSPAAVVEFAKRKGFKIYPFIEKRKPDGSLDTDHFEDYKFGKYKEERYLTIHYSKKPLTKDGKYVEDFYFHYGDIPRNDPDLVAVVKKLKKKANGMCAELKIVKIPDNVNWEIDEYDGLEHVQEKCEKWC